MDVTKGEFAQRMGVTPGRVSQWIAAGIIGRDALVGDGRSARIRVEVAERQVGERRHPGQALSNGLLTRVGEAAEPVATIEVPNNDPARQIQLERLQQERRKNRREEIEEAQRNGELVPVDDHRRAVAKRAQEIVNVFVGMVPDIANAIAEKFEVPARDVTHLVQRIMAERRAKAAQMVRSEAEAMPETLETVVKTHD